MKQECKEYREKFEGYLDGTLGDKEKRKIEEHCQDCHECAVLLKEELKLIDMVRALEKRPAPDALRERVLGKLSADEEKVNLRDRLSRLFTLPRLKIIMEFSAIFIVIIAGWYVFNSEKFTREQDKLMFAEGVKRVEQIPESKLMAGVEVKIIEPPKEEVMEGYPVWRSQSVEGIDLKDKETLGRAMKSDKNRVSEMVDFAQLREKDEQIPRDRWGQEYLRAGIQRADVEESRRKIVADQIERLPSQPEKEPADSKDAESLSMHYSFAATSPLSTEEKLYGVAKYRLIVKAGEGRQELKQLASTARGIQSKPVSGSQQVLEIVRGIKDASIIDGADEEPTSKAKRFIVQLPVNQYRNLVEGLKSGGFEVQFLDDISAGYFEGGLSVAAAPARPPWRDGSYMVPASAAPSQTTPEKFQEVDKLGEVSLGVRVQEKMVAEEVPMSPREIRTIRVEILIEGE